MSALIWVHADALSRNHPVFRAAPPGTQALYVWDPADVARRGWTLKRCVFVLECLQEMQIDIVQGDMADVLNGLDADRIYRAKTPDPALNEIAESLTASVETIPADLFVTLPDGTDMGRFFRYWNKAKRSALRKD